MPDDSFKEFVLDQLRRCRRCGPESQRDSISQPRVVRNALPWVIRSKIISNLIGVASFHFTG